MTFRVKGIDRDCDTCECCGRTGLKLTVILARVDADGGEMETLRFGRDCAARATLLRRTGAAMERLALDAEAEEQEKERQRIHDVGTSGCDAVWIVESIGNNGANVTTLCRARGLRSEVVRWADARFPHLAINVRKPIVSVPLHEVYNFPLSRTPAAKPTARGMTDAQIDDAWDAHLRHLANDE